MAPSQEMNGAYSTVPAAHIEIKQTVLAAMLAPAPLKSRQYGAIQVCILLGRITLVAQQPIVIELSRERSVGLSVCPAASALWKNGGSDPDAIWHCRSEGSNDEAGGGVWRSVHGKGYFWGVNLGGAIVHRDL